MGPYECVASCHHLPGDKRSEAAFHVDSGSHLVSLSLPGHEGWSRTGNLERKSLLVLSPVQRARLPSYPIVHVTELKHTDPNFPSNSNAVGTSSGWNRIGTGCSHTWDWRFSCTQQALLPLLGAWEWSIDTEAGGGRREQRPETLQKRRACSSWRGLSPPKPLLSMGHLPGSHSQSVLLAGMHQTSSPGTIPGHTQGTQLSVMLLASLPEQYSPGPT